MRFTSDESDESESMPPPSPKSGSSRSLKRTHGRKRTSRNSSDSIDLTENENRTCSPNLARELNRLAPRSRYSKSPRNKNITQNTENNRNNITETTLNKAPKIISVSAQKRMRITDSLKSSLLVQLIDQSKIATDHNYGVRDPAYAKTDIKPRSLLNAKNTENSGTSNPGYETNQTVWCLEPPGLWFRGKILTVENSLLKIRMIEAHVESRSTTFITNHMNPHIRKVQPDTLAGCRYGDWVTVTDEDEKTGRILIGEEAPARISHFGKTSIKVMLNNLREIELDLGKNKSSVVKNVGKNVGKNESQDPNSSKTNTQNWINQPQQIKKLPCESILPAYGIRDAAYALPFGFDKYHSTTNKNNVTKNYNSNEFYETGKIVQVFDFGRDGEGMWEDATIEDFCMINKAVKIQYPNYSKRWGLWTDVQSPHIREYMPKTPPASMVSGGSKSPGKKCNSQISLFNPSKLSPKELDSYIFKHFKLGKKLLSKWKGSDKEFYACTVMSVTPNSVFVEFTDGMKVEVKNLRWFRNCTGECTDKEWLKMESFAENEFWNKTGGKKQMNVLYPYKDEQ
jgi:hypothetical protein